ncbi:MAG: hypothetical protein WCF04_07850 [Candidatus Nanopelagicales bacterium]
MSAGDRFAFVVMVAFSTAVMVLPGAFLGWLYGQRSGNVRKATLVGLAAGIAVLMLFSELAPDASGWVLVGLFLLALSCLVGRAIAFSKGRAVAGLFLGLLGPFGWLIAALLPPSTEVQQRRDQDRDQSLAHRGTARART